MTERRSAKAERVTVDRFIAKYMKSKIGAQFNARINSVTRFGLFITLDKSGADGLIPMRSLPKDFYILNQTKTSLIGRKKKYSFNIGQSLSVRLEEASPLTGGLIFSLLKKDLSDKLYISRQKNKKNNAQHNI